MKKGKKMRWCMAVVFIAAVFCFIAPADVWGAELNHGKLPTGVTPESLTISWKNATYENRNVDILETEGYCSLEKIKYRMICIPKIGASSSCQNPFTIRFRDAGRINGTDVDVLCKVNSVKLYPEWSGIKLKGKYLNGKTWMSIAYSKNGYDNGLYAFGDENGLNSFFYDVKKTFDCQFSVVKKETNEVIPCRFFVAGYDIDWYYNTNREEYFEFYHDYFDSLFTYTSSFLSSSAADNIQKYYIRTYQEQGLVEGTASWYKAGVIGVTPQNATSARVKITVSNSNIPILLGAVTQDAPEKRVDKEICQPGDTLTYSVVQKNGKYVKNTFSPYSNMVIQDAIPNGVSFVSAQMFDGDTDVTDSAGEMIWDEGNRIVSYTFSKSWLDNMNNYKGQALKMVIKTRADALEVSRMEITNKAVSHIDGVTGESNQVTTTIVKPQLELEKIAEGGDVFYPGGKLVYKIKVSLETHEVEGRNVEVHDELPQGIIPDGEPVLTGADGTISRQGQEITCKIPRMRGNEMGVIVIPCRIDDAAPGTVRNTSEAVCDGGEPVTGSVDIEIGRSLPTNVSMSVNHTDKWQSNLDYYNSMVDEDKRRDQTTFWAGEFFVIRSELEYESDQIDSSTLPVSAYIVGETDDKGDIYKTNFDSDYKIEKTEKGTYVVKQKAVLWDDSMFLRWGGNEPKLLKICCCYGDSDKVEETCFEVKVDNRKDYYMLHRKK